MNTEEVNNTENSEYGNDSDNNAQKKKSGKKVVLIILSSVIVLGILSIIVFRNQIGECINKLFGSIDKPIIYLYPAEDTDILVEFGNPENITVSYPEYKEGWRVKAKPSGDLIDAYTGKNLYALYYECNANEKMAVKDYGFIVKSDEIIGFLEEKLAVLGLNYREREEFIVYWLPKLKENEYNYIRFADKEEIEKNMPLDIDPKPDTFIRVLMTYKGIEEPLKIQEQQLKKADRVGFVAVEWGGTLIP